MATQTHTHGGWMRESCVAFRALTSHCTRIQMRESPERERDLESELIDEDSGCRVDGILDQRQREGGRRARERVKPRVKE